MLLSMVYLNFVLISDDLVLFCFDVSLKRKNLAKEFTAKSGDCAYLHSFCCVFASKFVGVNMLSGSCF